LPRTCYRCNGSGWAGVIGQGDRDTMPCPKCKGTGVIGNGLSWFIPRLRFPVILIIAGIAYLGYQFGVQTAAHIGSDRPAFFAMVGGYAAILLLSMRGTGIVGPIVLIGLVEFVGHLYLGGSIHRHILNAF